MFLSNFNFVILDLKIHPGARVNTSKTLQSKRKVISFR